MSQSVRKFFDSQVAAYASNFEQQATGAGFCFRTRLDIVQNLSAGASGRLLDCACGTGEITKAALMAGNFLAGTVVDISQSMLDRTRSLIESQTIGTSVTWKLADIFSHLEASAVEKQRYDLILALGLIAHTGRVDELLGMLRQHLTPRGRILLQSTLIDHPGAKLLSITSRSRHRRQKGYDITWYRLSDIRNAARRAGLSITGLHRYGVCLPWGDRVCPKGNHWLEHRLTPLGRRFGAESIFVLADSSSIAE